MTTRGDRKPATLYAGSSTKTSILVCVLIVVTAAALGGGPAGAATGDSFFDQGKQWGMQKIGAETAWQVGTGAGITIAIVDTGVDLSHQDLVGKFVPGTDYIDGDDNPQDQNGHGTHVAGITAAIKGNGGAVGVAPDAKIMPVRVLDADGKCVGTCHIDDGIIWAADHGAQVINLSLGDFVQAVLGPSFGSALEYAWSKGAIPVVAAGNNYILASGYENDPALVVSATDRDDRKSSFSSGVGAAQWGIAAPGGSGGSNPEDDILSTYFDPSKPTQHNLYAYVAGTSMAAPHVAGAAALLRSKGLSPQETVDKLRATAKDLGAPGRDSTFGYGRLDLAKAVEGMAPAINSSPTPPPGGTKTSGGTTSTKTGSGTSGGTTTISSGSGTSGGSDPSNGQSGTTTIRIQRPQLVEEEITDPNDPGALPDQPSTEGGREVPKTALYIILAIILLGGIMLNRASQPD